MFLLVLNLDLPFVGILTVCKCLPFLLFLAGLGFIVVNNRIIFLTFDSCSHTFSPSINLCLKARQVRFSFMDMSIVPRITAGTQ